MKRNLMIVVLAVAMIIGVAGTASANAVRPRTSTPMHLADTLWYVSAYNTYTLASAAGTDRPQRISNVHVEQTRGWTYVGPLGYPPFFQEFSTIQVRWLDVFGNKVCPTVTKYNVTTVDLSCSKRVYRAFVVINVHRAFTRPIGVWVYPNRR